MSPFSFEHGNGAVSVSKSLKAQLIKKFFSQNFYIWFLFYFSKSPNEFIRKENYEEHKFILLFNSAKMPCLLALVTAIIVKVLKLNQTKLDSV